MEVLHADPSWHGHLDTRPWRQRGRHRTVPPSLAFLHGGLRVWSAHLFQASVVGTPRSSLSCCSRTALTSAIHRLVTPPISGVHSSPALHAPGQAHSGLELAAQACGIDQRSLVPSEREAFQVQCLLRARYCPVMWYMPLAILYQAWSLISGKTALLTEGS